MTKITIKEIVTNPYHVHGWGWCVKVILDVNGTEIDKTEFFSTRELAESIKVGNSWDEKQ